MTTKEIIEKYKNGDIAIFIPNKKECERIMTMFSQKGLKWIDQEVMKNGDEDFFTTKYPYLFAGAFYKKNEIEEIVAKTINSSEIKFSSIILKTIIL